MSHSKTFSLSCEGYEREREGGLDTWQKYVSDFLGNWAISCMDGSLSSLKEFHSNALCICISTFALALYSCVQPFPGCLNIHEA